MTELDPAVTDALADRLAAARDDGDPVDRKAILARVQQGLFADAEDPLRIGRFEVSRRLGSGASGVVYAAHDPKLDRKIALKLLRTDADLGEHAHDRLLREAQALARLSHPHVVAVHDVGDLDDRVFIAMELLEGGTLRRWAREQPRSTDEVLRAYVQAGEGLAAAHAAGLVHRDFKPDNVLLDDDGRVAVVDFGLAREQLDPGMSIVDAVTTGELPGIEVDDRLTRTGAVLGTPAYMAPEQLAGRRADARTDQYSYCVSLYEALYGERPYSGETLPALAMAAQRGEVRPPPPGRSVPAWIRRAVVRGLRPEPSQRHPSMQALLLALRRDPWARWRRRGVGAAVLAATVATTWAATDHSTPATPAAPCSGVGQHLHGVWDDERRAAAVRGLEGSGHPGGETTWQRLEPRVDAYANAWVEARRDVCEARHLRQDESDDLLDRRRLCLDRALLALDAAARLLAEADPEMVARAQEVVPEPVTIEDCSGEGVLDDGDPPPADPELRQRIRELELALADVTRLRLAGRWTESLSRAETLAADAAAAGHPPLHARALLELGASRTQAQHVPDAIEALSRAVAQAERGRSDRTRVLAYTLLVKRLADIGSFDEARRMAPVTEALYARLARPPAGADVRVQLLWGQLEWMEGNYDAALERFDRAIEASANDGQLDLLGLHSEAIGHRGAVALQAGYTERALPDLQRALELREQLVGPEHPEMGALHTNLGNGYIRLGDDARAEQHLRRSLEIRRRRFGSDHESMASTLSALGSVLMRTERVDEALDRFERSIALMRRSLGPDDPKLAVPLHNLALALLRKEGADPDRGRALIREALELRRRTLGPHHPRTLDSMYQLAYFERQVDDLDAAKAAYEDCLALLREHRPDDTVSQAYALLGLSNVALARDQPRRAQTQIELARALLGPDAPDRELRGALAFDLADALDRQGRSPDRALALAHDALELVRDSSRRTTISTWIAERSDPADSAEQQP